MRQRKEVWMEIKRFEDLIAWQKARELTKQTYIMTRKEPFCKDFVLCSQIQRAAVSIMSNLAEGFERGSSAEFHQFIVIAKSSCAELRFTALCCIRCRLHRQWSVWCYQFSGLGSFQNHRWSESLRSQSKTQQITHCSLLVTRYLNLKSEGI